MLRRRLFALVLGFAALLSGCVSTPPVNSALNNSALKLALAPSGALRVGVYPGSPTSLVRDAKTGEATGIALNLGQALGKQLGMPIQVVEFPRLALVLDALKAGSVDVTFTNATPARALEMDFTQPLIQLELGFLVPQDSKLNKPTGLASIADIDRAGIKVGVGQGSSSQTALPRILKNATVGAAASLAQAQQMLMRGELDAFATNKAILFEMSQALPGSRVLDGRWGTENMAIAIPKGREEALPYLRQFAKDVRANGTLGSFVSKSGLRGTVQPD